MYMTSIISHGIKSRETPNDKFYTPISLVKIHLKLVKDYVKDKDIILDPFAGDGKYINLYPDYFKDNEFDFTEIDKGLDFFQYSKKVDAIISNPPYSCIDKVLEKSVELKPHTISYLIGINNLTTKRIEYMNKNGYFLSKLHLSKVYKWYGMSVICIFTKNSENCVSFDRIVHK